MATAAILKEVDIAKAFTHVGYRFCKVSLQKDQPSLRYMKLKMFVYFCGYHGNGSHFEKSEYSKSAYSLMLSLM